MTSMTFRWFASALLLWTTVASAQTSPGAPTQPTSPTESAQAAPSGKDQRSLREVLDSATKLFQAGSYDQAIVEFQVAYTKRQLPTLLFNIAQAHRKAGHWSEALALYERFLRDDPKSALLLVAKQKEKPIYKKAWFWGVIGGLAAAGAVTAGVVIAVQQREPSADLGVRVVEF